MEILGIDVGGSGIKGAPVDTNTGALMGERFRIKTPKGAIFQIEPVQIFDAFPDAKMRSVLEKIPGDLSFAVPFAPLTHFPSHEEKFLSRVADHVAVEEA